nr:hypothetical protein [Pyxidicoccus parkwaysis]
MAGGAAEAASFTLFESGQVRPLALSPNGKLLFATNTPDNRLEIFSVGSNGLTHRDSVPVGLEPVAVAARGNDEVWVVNHLSDSVSVVRVDGNGSGTVTRTLLVGDEPRDIVFAGPGRKRAFITAAHRGQNAPFDPQLTTPGIGRADVWVFDSENLGNTLGGTPLTIVRLFSDTPRALAVTPDGSRVYAAAFHSGNRTTVIAERIIPDGGEAAGGNPGPNTNFQGVPAPEVAMILKYNGQDWLDAVGRPWNDKVRLSLPDKDVFAISATANPPVQLPGSAGFYTGVGTILFNMAVNPVNGKVYVSNTEARNDLRFEGAGIFAGKSLRGHIHESRITVLGGPGSVTPRHLNKHINYNVCCAPVPNAESEKSLAQPTGMAVSSNGATLYVAAFGSSKLGVYSTAALESDTFVPSTANQVELTGGGPTGLVLDEARGRLYVLTRFDNSISVVNTSTKQEVAHVGMFNPEPASVVQGRPFLYDARHSSSHGDSSCASCHIFGDFDSLVWDLGNPDGVVKLNPTPIIPILPEFGDDPTLGQDTSFHPLKGPMSTQSLRGMANQGPMHWRGDRNGGFNEPSAQPATGSFNEAAGFKQFNPAFMDLLGRSSQLPEQDMQKFTDFILQVMYPPNPIRKLDNSLTPEQQAGRDFFFSTTVTFQGSCEVCHRIDPGANPSEGQFKGFFGTDGRTGFDAGRQFPKVPHLRNAYQKVGMFGVAFTSGSTVPPDEFLGDQVRGFGYNSDGTIPTLFRFGSDFDLSLLNPAGLPHTEASRIAKRNMEQYMLAVESNFAPIVGQQVTLTSGNAYVAGPRIDLLRQRAEAGECDLVAKGRTSSYDAGFLYVGNRRFKGDRQSWPLVSDSDLRLATVLGNGVMTYTCVPPGSGTRIGLDRDLDGHLDGDEHDQGLDAANALSHP